ncbi:uncharacterized protein LTR77_008516 [Saxophila tyrrhenica]|uniref:Uncharacterized protein n=1 Tax=Saxophila tyrrhenica TaxID=1690608 RepID=A0AAV9P4W0_9PEZI|nr:hypothetical protein LTR77_008516 [Saxophila tyrrhenica]
MTAKAWARQEEATRERAPHDEAERNKKRNQVPPHLHPFHLVHVLSEPKLTVTSAFRSCRTQTPSVRRRPG